jgi:ribosomal protein S12 methylthiotransferase
MVMNVMKKICIQTLGCGKNIVDSERIASAINNDLYEYTENPNDADVILLNTCGFIKDAADESFEVLEQIIDYKIHRKPELQLVMFGCLITRLANDEMLDDVKIKYPQVNAFFPVNALDDILTYLNGNVFAKQFINRTISIADGDYAYLRISDGCDRQCAFCAIPSIKGKYVSEPLEELVNEAKTLAKRGIKELILIGQETTNYGKDIGTDFYTLLDRLSQIEDLQSIRIMYAHPNSIDLRIFELMQKRPNICQYIDLPLQHISDNVLTAMKRGTPSNKIKQLLTDIRNIVPNICIASTFIVGFPGETNADFMQLYEFIRERNIDNVGVFMYSDEKGTASYNLPNKVPQKTIVQRYNKLIKLQEKISDMAMANDWDK